MKKRRELIIVTLFAISFLRFSKQDGHMEQSNFEKLENLIQDGNNKSKEMREEISDLKAELQAMKTSMKENNCKLSEKVETLSTCACVDRNAEKTDPYKGAGIEFDHERYDRKAWWSKKISDNYYTAGRPSSRMIKYAYESGFKSIISVVYFPTGRKQGDEYFPTTLESKDISERLAGIPYGIARPEKMLTWRTIDLVHSFTRFADSFPTPTLVHCNAAYVSIFVLLSYFANKTRIDPCFKPHVDIDNFFKIASSQGYDYSVEIEDALSIVAEVTGEDITRVKEISARYRPIILGHIAKTWRSYWQAKPLYKNIFFAGQVWSSNLENLNRAGYHAVINVRRGVTENSMPSQEEVTLLNIQAKTGTYNFEHGGRQSKKRLEETRIDVHKPNEYISETSKVNYEAINVFEFGDAIGYNETLERLAFGPFSGIKYLHKPKAMLMKKTAEKIRKGPVLFHCGRGYRALEYALPTAMKIWNLTEMWAKQRAKELGYPLSNENINKIKNILKSFV